MVLFLTSPFSRQLIFPPCGLFPSPISQSVQVSGAITRATGQLCWSFCSCFIVCHLKASLACSNWLWWWDDAFAHQILPVVPHAWSLGPFCCCWLYLCAHLLLFKNRGVMVAKVTKFKSLVPSSKVLLGPGWTRTLRFFSWHGDTSTVILVSLLLGS